MDRDIKSRTIFGSKKYNLNLSLGKVDRTSASRFASETRKWKKTNSGPRECRRTEWTAAIDPRRYSMSRVMAMWTDGPDGLRYQVEFDLRIEEIGLEFEFEKVDRTSAWP
ncbi:hypothetical protein Syun_004039 [Stephania yunnanensis]|uniref:Uncharacterized protein n=1 Tax=Stephania yunnanensis TaxID=152371 RepID=A0AAP0L294_9MAGN